MARSHFGGTSLDWMIQPYALGSGTLIALRTGTTTLEFYSAATGGTHYTDLLDAAGSPITHVVVTGYQVPDFQGPDGILAMWTDKGDGSPRDKIQAQDLAAAAAALASMTSAASTKVDKGSLVVNVKDYGAVGNGTTSDTAAFTSALAVGQTVMAPPSSSGYLIDSALTIPANARIVGAGKSLTKILKGFNGDMITMGASASISDLTIEGQGATFTGRGITIAGTSGKQTLARVNLSNFDGPCIYFEQAAGSQFRAVNLDVNRVSALTTTGRYAIVIDPATQLTAVPRSFFQLETQGTCAFDFGGCNNVYIAGSSMADLNYTANSRAVQIVASRILNQAALTIDGHNNGIVGSDLAPQVTIASGADNITVGPNSYNLQPQVIDSSANGRNNITHWRTTYTPTLASGGTAPSLGNGTISGEYSSAGSMVTYTCTLTIGSTTTLGTGELRFGVPVTRSSSVICTAGNAIVTQGSTLTTAVAQFTGAVQYVRLVRDTSGIVTSSSPAAWTAGDTVRISGTYNR